MRSLDLTRGGSSKAPVKTRGQQFSDRSLSLGALHNLTAFNKAWELVNLQPPSASVRHLSATS